MALVRWRPFEDLMNMSNFDDFFGNILGGKFPLQRSRDDSEWIPRVDISENDEGILVRADAPGMSKDDVKITLNENVLTIVGEKKAERDEKKENYHRIERVFGKFQRSFYIPTNVDAEKISAAYNNGVLEVVLPKKEEAKPKEIPIKVE